MTTPKTPGEIRVEENWKRLVDKYDALIGNKYLDEKGKEYIFIGLLHGQDDYYFVMWRDKLPIQLLTCVGTLENMGFKPQVISVLVDLEA